MSEKKIFNSKKELDNLFVILTSSAPKLPSEILEFNEKIEDFIIDIHQEGYNLGYEKGTEIKNEIDKNLE